MTTFLDAFADKATLLAIEVPNLIGTGREIEISIATTIAHQAVELALKAAALFWVSFRIPKTEFINT